MDGYIDHLIARNRLHILLFLAGQDRIIDNDGVAGVLSRGKNVSITTITDEDQTHSVQFDAPERLVQDMARWFKAQRRMSVQKPG